MYLLFTAPRIINELALGKKCRDLDTLKNPCKPTIYVEFPWQHMYLLFLFPCIINELALEGGGVEISTPL